MMTSTTFKRLLDGDQGSRSKKHASFLIPFVRSMKPFADADDLSEKKRNLEYPMVGMQFRWDGRFGFSGGFHEGKETPFEAVAREFMEETFLGIMDAKALKHLCSHESERTVFHHFSWEMDAWTMSQVKSSANRAMLRSTGEVSGYVVAPVFYDKKGSGLVNILGNRFAGNSVQALAILLNDEKLLAHEQLLSAFGMTDESFNAFLR